MKHYEFPSFSRLFVVNNLSGNLETKVKHIISSKLTPYESYHPSKTLSDMFREKKKAQKNEQRQCYPPNKNRYSDSVIVVNGNCGIERIKDEALADLNQLLEKENIILLLVRGNNENPSIFAEDRIDLSNIISLQDICIVKIGNKNMLCVGGGISINRKWKMKNDSRLNIRTYYENEFPVFGEKDREDLLSFLESNKIDVVVSFESPSFALKTKINSVAEIWASNDQNLLKDITKCKRLLNEIYMCFYETSVTPSLWVVNSHPEHVLQSPINGIYFVGCPKNEITDIGAIIHLDYDKNANIRKKVIAKEDENRLQTLITEDIFEHDSNLSVGSISDFMRHLSDIKYVDNIYGTYGLDILGVSDGNTVTTTTDATDNRIEDIGF